MRNVVLQRTTEQDEEEQLAALSSPETSDSLGREGAHRIRERVHAALYWCERNRYSEWIDLGGQP